MKSTTAAALCLTALLLPPLSFAAAADAPPLPTQLPAENFQQVLARAGDDLFIAGQPSEAGLEQMRAAGVTTVVNLRTDREMDDRSVVPFDEAALAAQLGLTYVHVPAGGPDTPYTPEMVDRFAEALAEADGKVLLHCTVAWRASHLYTAWLHRYRHLPLPEAVRHGQAINLGTLPLEGFLGTPLTIEAGSR